MIPLNKPSFKRSSKNFAKLSYNLNQHSEIDTHQKIYQANITPFNGLADGEEIVETIDLFLSKIGTTKYHKILIFSLILIFMADGAEMVVIALTVDCIAQEFNLDSSQKGLVGSIVFFGLLIGTLSSSKICDKYGRKKIIIFGAWMITTFGFLTALSSSFYTLILFRFLLGMGIGLVIPSSTSLVSETVPSEHRSFYLNNIWVAFPIGEIFVYFISYFSLDENNCIGWRWLMGLSALPSFISFILILNIKESARFLIFNDKEEEGFKILDEIGAEKFYKLTEYEKRMIKTEIAENISNKIVAKYSSLIYVPEYRTVTLQLWALWLLISIVFYGGLYIFPQILKAIQYEEHNKENLYIELIITSIFYVPVTLASGYLSERPKLGRKYTMIIGFLMCFIVSCVCIIFNTMNYITYSLLRFGIGISFSVIAVYTSEIYPTRIRTLGNSAGNAFTRLGGIFSPFIMEYFFENYGYKSTLIVFAFSSGLCAYICKMLQVDTYKKNLDFSLTNELNKQKLLI